MSRQAHIRMFDYQTGTELSVTLEGAARLVKRATFTSRVGPDMLLKGKDGRVTHEVYDARKLELFMEEEAMEPCE